MNTLVNKTMKTHLISATILIVWVLLIWAMVAIDHVFLGVITVLVLACMYACIYLAIIRRTGDKS